MKDINPETYKRAWHYHIEQLAKLALNARIHYDDYIRVKRELETWIELATTEIEEPKNG